MNANKRFKGESNETEKLYEVMKESGAKADVERPLLTMDINIRIELIEFKIFPYYGPIDKHENLVL